jgi:quercetin dioxygenase-like cupin family protein
MKISHIPPALLFLLAIGLTGWSDAQTQTDEGGFVRIKPANIKWGNVPGMPGLQSALLAGDPAKPGLYVLRVKFAPGVMTRPHIHSQDRFVTVISGTWYTGTGEKFEPDKTEGLPPGSFMKHPAKAAHYDGAKKDEVIVQISGMGPVTTEYINSADDPNKKTVR